VGKLTLSEQRAHFALWALMKAPLLIGADLRSIHPDSLAVLKAREVIAVSQDELGVAGDLIWMQGASRVSGGGQQRVQTLLQVLRSSRSINFKLINRSLLRRSTPARWQVARGPWCCSTCTPPAGST
jgi:hypothetical protein